MTLFLNNSKQIFDNFSPYENWHPFWQYFIKFFMFLSFRKCVKICFACKICQNLSNSYRSTLFLVFSLNDPLFWEKSLTKRPLHVVLSCCPCIPVTSKVECAPPPIISNICDIIKMNESDVRNVDLKLKGSKGGNYIVSLCFERSTSLCISGTRWPIGIGFGSKCSIFEWWTSSCDEKSKLTIADMWLISLDHVTFILLPCHLGVGLSCHHMMTMKCHNINGLKMR